MPFAAEEANAQAADCAEFDVFTPSSGPWEGSPPSSHMGDLNGTLAAIVASFPNLLSKELFFQLRTSPGASIIQAETNIPADNIPLFDVNGTPRQPNTGEIFRIFDTAAASGEVGSTEEFRIYVNTVGDDLRLANLPAEKKCAADLDSTADEFFLHSTDYTPYDSTATPSATTYIGYAAPTCDAPEMTLEDSGANAGLGCRPTESGDCTGEVFHIDRCVANCPANFNDDDGNGICDADVVQTPTCGENASLNQDTNMCECNSGFNDEDGDGNCTRTDNTEQTPPPQTQTSAATPESDEGFPTEDALIAYGGVIGVVLAAHFLWDGNPNAFAFSPDFGYSVNESGYAINAGGRVDFRKDRWHLYWTAGQTNANGDFGDFRYSSGGKWQGDIFVAAFSEKVQGETADYDLSLSANWTGGIWKVSPAFAIDSVYEKGEFATTNSFRINGELLYDDWRFSASGNKTQMELSAVLEF